MAYQESFISYDYDDYEDAYIISYLWVRPEERGQGKGRKLLQDAIDDMRKERKADKIKLSADSESMDPENPIDLFDLVEFYESEGFVITCCEGHGVIMELSI